MTTGNQPRFDLDVLRQSAGEKVFARGVAYHRDGQVEILLVEPDRVLAQVEGSENYRVEITGHGKNYGGECSCRAFADWGYCKHLVATAIAANDLSAGATDRAGALGRIRDHLTKKGVDALADLVLDLAMKDPALFRQLETAAALMHDDDKTLRARLRKAIDNATRTKGYVDYRKASNWAFEVATVLETVATLASGPRAALAAELAEYAFDRIMLASQSIDDSDGHCGELLTQAHDIHVASILEARPEPVQLARSLFAREMRDDYDFFDVASESYAEALGEAGLAEYRRLAVEAWEKLPLRRKGRGQEEGSDKRHRLAAILDAFAERDGDVETRIALRAADLSSQWRYLQLAEFCRSQGREDEALRRAEEGLWLFEDEPQDERLVLFVVDLLSKAGRNKEAVAHLRRLFEKAPSLDLYERLGKHGGEDACDRARTFLAQVLASGRRGNRHGCSDLLTRIHMQEKDLDAAWAVMQQHGASIDVEEELARASEVTHPARAIEAYTACVDEFVNSGTASAYENAAKLVRRIAKLRSSGEQLAYVEALKLRFGRKPNFVKLLG